MEKMVGLLSMTSFLPRTFNLSHCHNVEFFLKCLGYCVLGYALPNAAFCFSALGQFAVGIDQMMLPAWYGHSYYTGKALLTAPGLQNVETEFCCNNKPRGSMVPKTWELECSIPLFYILRPNHVTSTRNCGIVVIPPDTTCHDLQGFLVVGPLM